MARARRTSQSKTKPETQSEGTGEFTCPECGRMFTRAASLGAHRRRAHGIAGASGKSRTTTGRRRRGQAGTSPRSGGAARGRRRSTDGAGTQVDRDALLQALFPNGVPAREAVIRAANDWLDQAEQLAKLK